MSEQEQKTQEQLRSERKFAQLADYKKTFGSEQGKRVLYDLMNSHFIMGPTNPRGSDPYEMAFNEGQRYVLLRIMTMLKVSPERMNQLIEESNNHATK